MPVLGTGFGLQHPNRVLFNGILDSYPGASAAYSLRKLRSDQVNAVRVRESGGDTEADIGFIGSSLDTASLLSHCGVNDGFVVTWYDQSGSGNNATQATASFQPKIVNAGSLITGGIDFDGVNDFVTTSTKVVKPETNPCSVFVVRTASSLIDGKGLMAEQDTSVSSQFILGGAAAGTEALWVNATQFGTSVAGKALVGFDWDEVNFQAHVNGSASGSAGPATVNNTGADLTTIGAHAVDSKNLFFDGQVAEVISYMSNQSAHRTAIENNLNTYYSIY